MRFFNLYLNRILRLFIYLIWRMLYNKIYYSSVICLINDITPQFVECGKKIYIGRNARIVGSLGPFENRMGLQCRGAFAASQGGSARLRHRRFPRGSRKRRES